MSDARPDIPGYEVETELGRGGMGVVYRVRQRSSGSVLALKMILRGRAAAFAELARFRIEAEALACLNHPNIVKIRDVGWYCGYPYFAMDFAERGSLRHVVSGRPQKPQWTAELVRTLALAMQHAHERGILHRDLKPANVLLKHDGEPMVTDFGLVKFASPVRDVSESYRTFSVSELDIELGRFARELRAQYDHDLLLSGSDLPAWPCRETDGEDEKTTNHHRDEMTRKWWEQCGARTGVLGDPGQFLSVRKFLAEAETQPREGGPDLDGLTEDGAVIGSPNYMAPEQATGALARIGPRTDVYALGGILYELLTGKPAFRSTSVFDLLDKVISAPPTAPRELVRGLSRDLEAVCLKCLEKEPDSRYPSAAALADDLSRFLDGHSARAAAASPNVAQPEPLPAEPERTDSWRPRGNGEHGATTENAAHRRPSELLATSVPVVVIAGGLVAGIVCRSAHPAPDPARDSSSNRASLATSPAQPHQAADRLREAVDLKLLTEVERQLESDARFVQAAETYYAAEWGKQRSEHGDKHGQRVDEATAAVEGSVVPAGHSPLRQEQLDRALAAIQRRQFVLDNLRIDKSAGSENARLANARSKCSDLVERLTRCRPLGDAKRVEGK